MAPRLLLLATLLAVGCTCQSDGDCPLDEQCTDGTCVARSTGGGGRTGHLLLSPSSTTVQTHAGDPSPAVGFGVGNDGSATLSFNVSCDQGAPTPVNGLVAVNATTPVSVALPTWFTAGI